MFLSRLFFRKSRNKKSWYTNAVVYQIYPLSFKDSDDDGVGDLSGILKKLDYLAGNKDSLGVDAIWLTPFFPSPMKDMGYDVSDYYNVDPRFGSLDIFKKLVSECHERNLKVIIDLVTNHTSSEHPWFMESRRNRDNSKRNWYVWKEPSGDGGPPTNWLSVSGGSAWTYDEETAEYYLHKFLPQQPDLNWRNPEVMDEMGKILNFWIDLGVDGFRVDAMSHYLEDEFFRDNPINPHFQAGDHSYSFHKNVHSEHLPETSEIIEYFCDTVQNRGDYPIITESYLDIDGLKNIYDSVSRKNHIPFNFNLITTPWRALLFKDFIDEYEKVVGPNRIPCYVLGNHDQSRILTRLGPQRSILATVLLMTLRGTAFIYYGDEIGMGDVSVPPDLAQDGFATVSPEPTESRDPERTPMQWDSCRANYGFSSVKPWLPTPEFESVNVASELKNNESFLSIYKKLIQLRKKRRSLGFGSYIPHSSSEEDVFSFARMSEDELTHIFINFSHRYVEERLTPAFNMRIIFSTNTHRVNEKIKAGAPIKLEPYEAVIVEMN